MEDVTPIWINLLARVKSAVSTIYVLFFVFGLCLWGRLQGVDVSPRRGESQAKDPFQSKSQDNKVEPGTSLDSAVLGNEHLLDVLLKAHKIPKKGLHTQDIINLAKSELGRTSINYAIKGSLQPRTDRKEVRCSTEELSLFEMFVLISSQVKVSISQSDNLIVVDITFLPKVDPELVIVCSK